MQLNQTIPRPFSGLHLSRFLSCSRFEYTRQSGLIFAVVLFPFQKVILESRQGWLKLWGLFLGLAIFSTAGPAAGSVEGLIYTKIPVIEQLPGLWEVVLQTLLCSVLFVAWYNKPARAWNVCMGVLVGLIVLMSVSGAFFEQPEASQLSAHVNVLKK